MLWQTKVEVEKLGGVVMSEKEPESENGYYMYFKDVAGNRFGIYELKQKQDYFLVAIFEMLLNDLFVSEHSGESEFHSSRRL